MVALIATHERIEITSTNIQSLLKNGCSVIVVSSNGKEAEHYKRLGAHSILHSNNPLGDKWQVGVDYYADQFVNDDALIIVGSDDLLSQRYFYEVPRLMKSGADFIGCTSWYTLDVQRNTMYHCEYQRLNADFPIGSGKCISRRMLERMKFMAFNRELNRKLDDYSYHKATEHKACMKLLRDPLVLAVKGPWSQMNSVDAYLRSSNIKSKEVPLDTLNQFDYVFNCRDQVKKSCLLTKNS